MKVKDSMRILWASEASEAEDPSILWLVGFVGSVAAGHSPPAVAHILVAVVQSLWAEVECTAMRNQSVATSIDLVIGCW